MLSPIKFVVNSYPRNCVDVTRVALQCFIIQDHIFMIGFYVSSMKDHVYTLKVLCLVLLSLYCNLFLQKHNYARRLQTKLQTVTQKILKEFMKTISNSCLITPCTSRVTEMGILKYIFC